MKSWKISILLMLLYIGCFHLWLIVPASAIIPIGIVIASLCFWICWKAKSYFANAYDRFFHYVIGFDLLVESFIPLHDGYEFYYCALAFAMVLGFYRYYARKNHKGRCLVSCFIKQSENAEGESDIN